MSHLGGGAYGWRRMMEYDSRRKYLHTSPSIRDINTDGRGTRVDIGTGEAGISIGREPADDTKVGKGVEE